MESAIARLIRGSAQPGSSTSGRSNCTGRAARACSSVATVGIRRSTGSVVNAIRGSVDKGFVPTPHDHDLAGGLQGADLAHDLGLRLLDLGQPLGAEELDLLG